ncbi:cytokine receptor common subunit gamma-like [Mantella aurantiaca]
MGPPVLLLLLLSVLRPGQGSAEVDCIMNTMKVLTCTWNHQQNPTENYTFYFRDVTQQSKAVPCPEYVIVNHTKMGCKRSVSDPYVTFSVKLESSAGPPVWKTFKRYQDYVKMDPPYNLITETSGNVELIVRWEQTYGEIPPHCVTYKVKHRSTAREIWTEKEASSALSSLSSFDSCQNYTFHVKSQISNVCANAVMWSEWSEGVTWTRNATECEDPPVTKPSPSPLQTGITVGLILLALVIFLALIGQERIWVILIPQIPNPGKKFEDLINGCSVQEWVGVSKEAVEKMKLNYTETFCTVTEDSECTGPDGKILPSNSPEN